MRLNAFFLMVLFTLSLAPHSSATHGSSTTQSSDYINPYTDEVLRYDDEMLVSVNNPIALPSEFPNYGSNLRNFNHEYLGEIYTNGNGLIDENGDVVEINGSIDYNLRNINDNYAIFGNGKYFSFRDGNLYNLTEPVPSESELAQSCSDKWVFLEACYNPVYYYENLDIQNFIFVENSYSHRSVDPDYGWWNSETRRTSFVYDLEKRDFVLSGEMDFLGDNQNTNRDYVLIDDKEQNQLVILNDDGSMKNIMKHDGGVGNNYVYSDFCFSEDLIFGLYRNYDSSDGNTKFFIEKATGQITNLSQMVYLNQELRYGGCVEYSTKNYMLVDSLPYTLSEYYNLIFANDTTEHYEMRAHINCGGTVGSTYSEDKFRSVTLKRFLYCNDEGQSSEDYSLFFDMETGDYIYLPKSHTPRFVYGDLVLIEKNQCFLWNTNDDKIVPIIDLSSSYSCSSILIHDGKVFLNNYLSLATFTSDGRIDLDNPLVYSGENSVVESFTSFVETTYESSFFTLLVSLILLVVILLNKRKLQNVLDELESETSMKIEALELELLRVMNSSDTFSVSNVNAPSIDSIGYPDDDGFEWFTSEDGRNWYRSQGSSEEWVEYSN